MSELDRLIYGPWCWSLTRWHWPRRAGHGPAANGAAAYQLSPLAQVQRAGIGPEGRAVPGAGWLLAQEPLPGCDELTGLRRAP